MKETLFIGRRLDDDLDCCDNAWVEGSLISLDENTYILTKDCFNKGIDIGGWFQGRMYEVDPETVRQYIGVKDKNKNKIFEDSIVSCKDFRGKKITGYIYYDCATASYRVIKMGCYCSIALSECKNINIIGSIQNNPELIY